MTASLARIIVVGGGAIGLSMALACAQKGWEVVLIERGKAGRGSAERMLSLNRASDQFLTALGIGPLQEIPEALAYERMVVWDRQTAGSFKLQASDFLEPCLGYIVPESVLLQRLWAVVQAHPDIKIMSESQPLAWIPEGSGGTLSLASGLRFQGSLLIGADGAASWVREYHQIPLIRSEYGQHAVVATLRPEQAHQHTAHQCFDTTGPLALLPMVDGCVSLVWSVSSVQAQELCRLSEADFNRVVTLQSDHRLGRLCLLSPRRSYPLVMQHAKVYGLPGVVLIGDAAHTIHPLAGQGLNLGFADACALVQVLEAGAHRGQHFGQWTVLQRYQNIRLARNLEMIGAMKLFHWGFSTSLTPIQWLREGGMSLFSRIPWLKRWVVEQALGERSML